MVWCYSQSASRWSTWLARLTVGPRRSCRGLTGPAELDLSTNGFHILTDHADPVMIVKVVSTSKESLAKALFTQMRSCSVQPRGAPGQGLGGSRTWSWSCLPGDFRCTLICCWAPARSGGARGAPKQTQWASAHQSGKSSLKQSSLPSTTPGLRPNKISWSSQTRGFARRTPRANRRNHVAANPVRFSSKPGSFPW